MKLSASPEGMKAPIPKPDLKHCYSCGLDYPSGLQHPKDECYARQDEQRAAAEDKTWPPASMETK